MVDAIPATALPTPSFVHPTDDLEFDQSDWRDGALNTRYLDPDVNVRGYRLTWQSVSDAVRDLVLLHYDHYAPGGDGRDRQFGFTPPGGTELAGMWIGSPSVRPISNRFCNIEGAIAVLTATDFGAADPPGGTLVDTADFELVDPGGNALITGVYPTFPLVPPQNSHV